MSSLDDASAKDGPGWRTLLWSAWTAGWLVTEVGHSTPGAVDRASLPGFIAWLAVTVVMVATAAQESYMRHAYRVEEKDK